MIEGMKNKKEKVFIGTKDILELLEFIKSKGIVSISEINALKLYSKYATDSARDRARQRHLKQLIDSNFIKQIGDKYAYIDYPDQKLTALQKELSKIYNISLTPQEAYILKVWTDTDIFGLISVGVAQDNKKQIKSLYEKKNLFGYSDVSDMKFMELCQISATLKYKQITDLMIKDTLYRLNYDVTDQKNIKEFKDFIKLKNPSIIFKL